MGTVQDECCCTRNEKTRSRQRTLLMRIKKDRQFITVATKRELTARIVNTAPLVNGTDYS
jgi:hypothetical protein